MSNSLKTAQVAAFLFMVITTFSTRAAEVNERIDWPNYLGRHDLVWQRLPDKWENGGFTGNGLLGVMVHTINDGKELTFHVGRNDVMDHNSYRLDIGDFVLTPVGTIVGGNMRLDLWNAEITGNITTDRGNINFRAYTHADQIVQVLELFPSDGEAECKLEFRPAEAVNPRNVARKEPIPEDQKNPPPQRVDRGNLHGFVQQLRRGGEYATAWEEQKLDDGRRAFLSVGFAPDGSGAMDEAARNIQQVDPSKLEESHRAWWHRYYPASFINIPDTRLESFWWIQQYKIASATRPDRTAIDLMGPWFRRTPWPRIWWNLNIQLTYWPILAANHPEMVESLSRMMDRNKENLAKNAKEFADDSATIARTTGYDCVGAGGRELCNLPWAIHNVWLEYRYTMDESILRERVFPLLKRSVNFYLHNSKLGDDGKLHITAGYSPEYPEQPEPNPDCNIDLALLRWGCQTLIDTCARLKIDDPLIPRWKETLEKLTPYPADANGLRISASVPFEKSHRHYSHLLMIYPLYLMNWDQPENRELITKSLDHWMGLTGAHRGYSYTGAASICASIGRREEAVKHLQHFLGDTGRFGCLPNTMYVEAGPVIETPLSAAQSLNDILIQSWGGKIRLFPGVPDVWKDVTIHKMRTEGAFLISAARRDGKTKWLRIESLAGEPCIVQCGIDNPQADPQVALKSLDNGFVEIPLKKGESIVLYPQGDKPDLTIEPLPVKKDAVNSFGLGQ
jgi:hypothetical protein